MNLASDASFYFVKQPSIVSIIEKGGRTFYSKFEKVDKKPDLEIIKKHIDRKMTVAVPLIKKGHGDKIFILYEGNEQKRFLAILSKIIKHTSNNRYKIFYGETDNQLQIFLKTETGNMDDLHKKAANLSDMLGKSISKAWKILPDSRLPESYNIFILPYSIY